MNDPIVEETRKLREELVSRFNGNLERLCQNLISSQRSSGQPVIRRADRDPQNPSAIAATPIK